MKTEKVKSKCVKCRDEFIILYNNKEMNCKIIKSCKCGFNED